MRGVWIKKQWRQVFDSPTVPKGAVSFEVKSCVVKRHCFICNLRRGVFTANMNANLHKAKNTKNDEFYTQLTDVSKEMMHYKKHFKDKIIYCNCDNPTWSAFWEYFHINFTELGLKKLITTHYEKEKATYKMEYIGGDDNNIEVGLKTDLDGNGDFRSQECIDTLDEADIVVTNPPFSLFREYISVLMQHNKKFLIIGNMNAIAYTEIFPLIKDNKIWCGVSLNGSKCSFRVPDTYDGKNVFYKDGMKMAKINNAIWFTNLGHNKHHEKLALWKEYNSVDYPKYDNYDAIDCSLVSEIPCDFNGVIGVPITFLNKYNPDQFEIVSIRKGDDGKDLVFTREGKRIHPYSRILIRPRLQG